MDVSIVSPSGERVGPFREILGPQRFILGGTELLIYYGEPKALQCQAGNLYIFHSPAVLCRQRCVADHPHPQTYRGRRLADVAPGPGCVECWERHF